MSTLNVENIKNEAADSDSIQLATDGSMTLLGNITVRDTLTAGAINRDYRPGEIIEYLTHQCDGTTLDGAESRSYTWPNVTAVQAFTTTYADLTGSSITYTPPSGTKRVLYRFNWLFTDSGYGGISHYKFMIDGTEVNTAFTTLAANYPDPSSGVTVGHARLLNAFEYVIECDASSTDASLAQFTSWTSNKTLKIQAREYNTTYQASAHNNFWRDGAGASSPYDLKLPVLTIIAFA